MTEAIEVDQLTEDVIHSAALPSWLEQRKLDDLATFRDLPFPDSNRDEDWRKTDISRIDLRGYSLPGASRPNPAVAAELAAQGVTVSSLEDAAQTHGELVQRYLEHEVVPAAAGKFAAYNAAFWRGGVFIHVPRGVTATVPIRTAFALPDDGAGPQAILPRSLVVVEDGASLVYTDEYGAASAPAGGAALSSAVTEVVLGDNARIQYLVLQEWPDDVDHVATHRIHVGRDSNAELVVAATGGRISKVYMEVSMLGSGSSARISGLIIGHGKQHFDYQSLQDHRAPNCVSDLLVKGALKDEARSVYSGLIKIEKAAQHSDAYQANRNLLLSPRAKADSIPKLEIEANDVRCTHGATVGQVDAEQLFYLQSRGFSLEEAQNTLVHGFFQPVIDRIALEEVRARIHQAIDAELEGLEPEAAA
ncbi:MAG TPA: Fe-S cluster assembly protein SufD [Candidatus Dormibacteraeota bacterium]|nr:Fe-S cluster assembly protein SufD [Candidatus Dormibacteraeota bacterium]